MTSRSPIPPRGPRRPESRPPSRLVKDPRAFGRAEWRHVLDGVIGFVLGSAVPLALLYGSYRLFSFSAAVVVVLLWSTGVFVVHRARTGGWDIFSAWTFAFALIEAIVGLWSQNLLLYLATPSLKNLAWGVSFLGSALLGRPLLVAYAERLYPIPGEVKQTQVFRSAFLVVSSVWFFGMLIRGSARLWLLANVSFETYLLVDNTVVGWTISAFLLSFTVWYPLRQMARAGLYQRGKPICVLTHVADGLEAASPGAPAGNA